jgi:type VI protein secretion system component VasK
MLVTIKNRLILIGGAIISALLVTLKFMAASRARAVKQAKRAKAALKRQQDTQEIDNELDHQLSSRRAEIKREIEDKKSVKSLENPNDF